MADALHCSQSSTSDMPVGVNLCPAIQAWLEYSPDVNDDTLFLATLLRLQLKLLQWQCVKSIKTDYPRCTDQLSMCNSKLVLLLVEISVLC